MVPSHSLRFYRVRWTNVKLYALPKKFSFACRHCRQSEDTTPAKFVFVKCIILIQKGHAVSSQSTAMQFSSSYTRLLRKRSAFSCDRVLILSASVSFRVLHSYTDTIGGPKELFLPRSKRTITKKKEFDHFRSAVYTTLLRQQTFSSVRQTYMALHYGGCRRAEIYHVSKETALLILQPVPLIVATDANITSNRFIFFTKIGRTSEVGKGGISWRIGLFL